MFLQLIKQKVKIIDLQTIYNSIVGENISSNSYRIY